MLEAGDQDSGECWLAALRDASYTRYKVCVCDTHCFFWHYGNIKQ